MSAKTLVGMRMAQARWLGMAAAVAGGCVATSDAGRDAANLTGHDCIGLIPESWLPSKDYVRLSPEQISRVRAFLSVRVSGWSGANEVNTDRSQTAELLGLAEVAA